jgi:uncharacterized membrane protein YhaH (DUF805 family)
MMPQTTTFGRRGLAAPAPIQPAPRPKPTPAARVAPQAPARAQASFADPETRTVAAHFVWLLFRFDGRLSRITYRYCRIVSNLAFLVIIYSLRAASPRFADNLAMELLIAVLMLAALALMAWTTLAMQVKRRHDRDKSWPWLFVGFIPIIGPIWVLIETCWLDGTTGYNRFDDPAEIAARTFA